MTTELADLAECRRQECAYETPCKVCIHRACGSHRDQKRIEELEAKEAVKNMGLAKATDLPFKPLSCHVEARFGIQKTLCCKAKYTCNW